MRKILLALNAHDIKTPSIDFASYIASLTKSSVTGIFLESKYKKNSVETLVSGNGDEEYEPLILNNVKENMSLFENRCLNNYAKYSMHHVKGIPANEMIRESLFADVILSDGNVSFTDDDGWPSGFVKELLENAKCPVIITPDSFEEINEVVFAYDGTDSSVFAMKQFIYLFPEFNETKITLLHVLSDEDEDITEKERLKELLLTHYDAVHYDTLHGNTEMELFKKFLPQKNKLLVMGAYGRKKFIGHSTADILLKTTDIAIFITHY